LADLDADIEGNERQHKMIAGKLQFVAQRKRKPEAMTSPKMPVMSQRRARFGAIRFSNAM
jgi:hypothetical protein